MKQLELFNKEYDVIRHPIEPETEKDSKYAQHHYMLLNLVAQNAIQVYYNDKELTTDALTKILGRKVENQTQFRDNGLLSQIRRIFNNE